MTKATLCPICASSAQLLAAGVEDYYFRSPGSWDYLQCGDEHCGVAFPSPRPDAEALRQAYRTYYTHQGSDGSAAAIEMLAPLAQRLRNPVDDAGPGLPLLGWIAEQSIWDGSGALPAQRGETIVDIGAGDGGRLSRLRREGWEHAIGIEPDPSAVEMGQKQQIDLRLGTAEALPLADGSAAAAMLHHVIEHVDNPARAMAEAYRILRPGGKLLVVTPNIESATRVEWGKYWRGFEAPRHLVIFTARALGKLARNAGFEVQLVRTSGRSAAWMGQVSAGGAGKPAAHAAKLARLFAADGQYRAQQLAIAKGREIGDEIILLARRPLDR
ncbi:class I SAM-dependent methyltransferase [Sphingomonas sp. CBMAI 2297]|uniref:class I SAM-dependent methyltransferase n=1 Tax=Sphingomonas sp. CBMAI 2297 TaxID=2991720 RepID=UPI0024560197|nr:class I SAM-dependent methyltransferase [Sphingomonas sp. CBMAI 2297]MDH4742992.1 class I SAM-dependent methyltransferase [Sphingomonas sp. CBMAI 2297]